MGTVAIFTFREAAKHLERDPREVSALAFTTPGIRPRRVGTAYVLDEQDFGRLREAFERFDRARGVLAAS